jgi:hypothetical protein
MRLFGKALLVVTALVVALPLAIIALVAVFGLAIVALRIAIVVLLVWGGYRLLKALFGRSRKQSRTDEYTRLGPVDPYYEAARKELDRELGHA